MATATKSRQPDGEQLQQLLAGLTAVRSGDFGARLPEGRDPLMNEIAAVFNGMNEQLAVFTSEVTRVAREVGIDGKLGGQAQVPGGAGSWKDLTDSVNAMAGNLTGQVRTIAQVTTSVARGDLSQRIAVEAKGEVAALAETINGMVDTLSAFAGEVTRVAREVGTEGRLGGQADVQGVSGTWKDLTESVNVMAALQRRAGRQGRAAGRAKPGHRDQERRDRAGPAGDRRTRPPARPGLPLQVAVPRQHVPRAAHAAEQPARAGPAAGPKQRGQPHRQAGRVRQHHPLLRHRPAAADQRHPRPDQGRGRED